MNNKTLIVIDNKTKLIVKDFDVTAMPYAEIEKLVVRWNNDQYRTTMIFE